MDEEGAEVFDNLPELENKIPLDTKMSLVHIAGYVTRKDPELSEEALLSETQFYYQRYGDYTDGLDRGGLNVPTDYPCQWSFLCFCIFQSVKSKVCRKSLTNIFMLVSEHYSLKMKRKHGMILSNIFLKNFCRSVNPRSTKETSVKVLKLSDRS